MPLPWTDALRCRLQIALVLALAGLLAGCTLSVDTAPDSTAPVGQPTSAGRVANAGTAPDVRITDPASGATVPANQRVDLTVETDSTATRFQLTVNGGIASVKALPDDQSGPTSAILSWTPRDQGDYSLQVVAYNHTLPGDPASILLTVSGTASDSAGGATTACTGRVLVSQLNYRDGPGTGHTKLGQFDTGETATVLGRNAGDTWLKVRRLNMQEVWVINDPRWFQIQGQCAVLPVVE